MIVRNLNGDMQNSFSGADLLAHWDRFSRQTAYRCFVKGCRNKCSAGGRVQRDTAADGTWYVIPLCDDCNSKRHQDLDVWEGARLIPISFAGVSQGVHLGQAIRGTRTVASHA